MTIKKYTPLQKLERLLEGKSYDQYEWEGKLHGKKVFCLFNVLNHGMKTRPSSHYDEPPEGESPELDLVSAYDEDDNELKLSSSDKSDLEERAAEDYYDEYHGD